MDSPHAPCTETDLRLYSNPTGNNQWNDLTVKSDGLELFTQSNSFEAAKEASNVFADVPWLPGELLHPNYKFKVLLAT